VKKQNGFDVVMLPASAKSVIHVHYLRELERRSIILRWPKAKYPPKPERLRKGEWRRLTSLLLKLCESGYEEASRV
jgi:hypothetical protein